MSSNDGQDGHISVWERGKIFISTFNVGLLAVSWRSLGGQCRSMSVNVGGSALKDGHAAAKRWLVARNIENGCRPTELGLNCAERGHVWLYCGKSICVRAVLF